MPGSSITINSSSPLLFMPSPDLSCCYFSIVDLVIRSVILWHSFLAQDCFIYTGFLFIHMKLSIVLMRFVKNCVGILTGIVLNLQIAFGQMAIFYQVNTILS